jgi:hypothetical protein
MPEKIITATLHNISPVPNGAIYQGDGMFEFVTDKSPYNIDKKMAEYDVDAKTYYKDPAVKVTLESDKMVAEAEKTGKVEKIDKDGKPVKK